MYDMRMRERAAMNVNTTFFYDVTPCGLADTKVSEKTWCILRSCDRALQQISF
jgi:hypothetical protein